MRSGRTAIAAAGVCLSLLVSGLLWWDFGTPVFFLFVPILPLFFGRGRKPERRSCPQCGYETSDSGFEFCPRDGTRLEVPASTGG